MVIAVATWFMEMFQSEVATTTDSLGHLQRCRTSRMLIDKYDPAGAGICSGDLLQAPRCSSTYIGALVTAASTETPLPRRSCSSSSAAVTSEGPIRYALKPPATRAMKPLFSPLSLMMSESGFQVCAATPNSSIFGGNAEAEDATVCMPSPAAFVTATIPAGVARSGPYMPVPDMLQPWNVAFTDSSLSGGSDEV